jgi:hypothetical protein
VNKAFIAGHPTWLFVDAFHDTDGLDRLNCAALVRAAPSNLPMPVTALTFGQHAGYNFHAQFFADLPDDRSYPISQSAFQHFVAVLRDPDDVITMVENRVTSACVGHRLTP